MKVATVLFVPPSANALLFKLVKESENVVSKQFSWGVKILESP